ncbi:hypothetical protein [Rhizobium binxianense]|uniref:hypothetical protein n=1 Tax=Rhizobium binxianense TaxID=3024242 RepID=UPI0023628E8E|nr:hypothetical protein [Rhizobium sp. MJ37]MDC9834950.1 hypothetical protein [Rhizobium sp. MJ37]
MNAFDDTLHRVLARYQGRAIPTRTSSRLSPDPNVSIGIATIKIVTEEQIQAIAFGPLDEVPQVIVRLDPIGRDVQDLEPFAAVLADAVARAIELECAFRIWVPHSVTLEALDVLGHRYWRNQTAPSSIVRMGEICRIVAHEATIPGQQLVADATALLQDHAVTGLTPLEEGHLGAVLAWLDPAVGDPVAEARDRIRLPASGVLPNTPDCHWDDTVDRLRKEMKGAGGTRRRLLEEQLSDILRRAVLREWNLLIEGRRAFLRLGLPSALDELVKDSNKRVRDALVSGFFPARSPKHLVEQLSIMEAGQEKCEIAALEADWILRDQAVHAGVVVRGEVATVHQNKPGYKPCDIDVNSDQGVIRFRLDDKVRIVGTNVAGVVRSLNTAPGGGARVGIEITNGVRTRNVLAVGAYIELIREPYAFINYRSLGEAHTQQPWVFYGAVAPVLSSRRSPGQSALAIARALRR